MNEAALPLLVGLALVAAALAIILSLSFCGCCGNNSDCCGERTKNSRHKANRKEKDCQPGGKPICRGPPGAQGPTGSQGPNGAQGPPGTQGSNGGQGSIGSQGSNGAQGSIGDQGPAGPVGLVGPQGASAIIPFSSENLVTISRLGVVGQDFVGIIGVSSGFQMGPLVQGNPILIVPPLDTGWIAPANGIVARIDAQFTVNSGTNIGGVIIHVQVYEATPGSNTYTAVGAPVDLLSLPLLPPGVIPPGTIVYGSNTALGFSVTQGNSYFWEVHITTNDASDTITGTVRGGEFIVNLT